MKTKTVKIEGYINDLVAESFERNGIQWDSRGEFGFVLHEKQSHCQNTQAAFLAELPIPERTVTITESEFDKAAREVGEAPLGNYNNYLNDIKSKLFGGDK